MYGYRKNYENGLMTNLNSISSSLSSIDTIGRRSNTLGKSSVDNLINQSRSQSVASTSALYCTSRNDRYQSSTSARNSNSRYQSSQAYHARNSGQKTGRCCPNSQTALNLTLIPLLLLTILRQVFDFLGQMWLQILINFLTIIIIIIALFGMKQRRLLYLVIFAMWALFNTIWNLMVIVVYSRTRDISFNEDILSIYSGGVSWWQSNGPGCQPYTITAPIQHQSVSILRPNRITGCRIDYHLLESTQAALHSSLSLLSSLICCFAAWSVRHDGKMGKSNVSPYGRVGSDKPFRMSDLANGRTASKVNHNPYPTRSVQSSTATSRFVTDGSTSLRRSAMAIKRASSRSSQHSLASTRRRNRHMSETSGSGAFPGSKNWTGSTQRSQKYGSLSSRRSRNHRKIGGEASSLTYATTSGDNRNIAGPSMSQRSRLSSLSSAEYLPSYQPPHSSSANLLSSYGEISSIDSYTNRMSNRKNDLRQDERSTVGRGGGNTNPTYNGSRSSIYSQNLNNYDDISNVYGSNHMTANGSVYGATVVAGDERVKYNNCEDKRFPNGRTINNQASGSRDIQAEIYKQNGSTYGINRINHQQSRVNTYTNNGGGFQSFSSSSQQNLQRQKANGVVEVNNNYLTSS